MTRLLIFIDDFFNCGVIDYSNSSLTDDEILDIADYKGEYAIDKYLLYTPLDCDHYRELLKEYLEDASI